jgi:tetratricopeptide (TPR) repeat protein
VKERAGFILPGVALLVVTACAYLPVADCAFIWDDETYIERNETLRSIDGLRRIWFDIGATPQYYPLVHTTFWLEYQGWGLNPAGYHVVNVLLHGLAAVLLWRVLSFLKVPAAWFAAAVFALHPVHVESVAWITERKNVLSGVFYLASALAYLKLALPAVDESTSTSRWKLYVASLLLFLCAVLSKTVTCTLPGALLLVLWWKRGRVRVRDVGELGPFFVIGIGFGLVTIWMEKEMVGARGEAWDFSFLDRFLLAGRVICFYATKLVWPAGLTFIYPRWNIDATEWHQYVYPATVMVVVVALWLARRRIGAGPLVAVLFFIGTLFPALGFFDVYPMRFSFVADHFQYLASIGPIALAVSLVRVGVDRIRTRARPVGLVAACVLLIVLGTLTWRQVPVYANVETLWRDTLAKNPDAWIAHNNLGVVLQDQGKHEQAVHHFREVVRLTPEYWKGHKNLGDALQRSGRLDEAVDHYQIAVEIAGGSAEAHNTLGVALTMIGRMDEAAHHFREAIRLKEDFPEAMNGLAWILATHPEESVRDPAEAVRLAERAVELTARQDAAMLDTLAAACASAGQFERAVSVAREALQRPANDRETRWLAQQIRRRLALYEAGQPYREAVRRRQSGSQADSD